MKKFLFLLTAGVTSVSAFSNCGYAQKSAEPIAFNSPKILKSSVFNMAVLEPSPFLGEAADAKTINHKALKDFQTRFAHAGNTSWYSDRNGFMSYFVLDGLGNRAYYDKNGRWQYSLIFYREDKMPKAIRAIVKSTYYDMQITLVEEVQIPEGMVYVVHLEDKANIKIVKLNPDGDMETMQDLLK